MTLSDNNIIFFSGQEHRAAHRPIISPPKCADRTVLAGLSSSAEGYAIVVINESIAPIPTITAPSK